MIITFYSLIMMFTLCRDRLISYLLPGTRFCPDGGGSYPDADQLIIIYNNHSTTDLLVDCYISHLISVIII